MFNPQSRVAPRATSAIFSLTPDVRRRQHATTDKTFLIAKPMRKVSWTKHLAAGWEERGARNGGGEVDESG